MPTYNPYIKTSVADNTSLSTNHMIPITNHRPTETKITQAESYSVDIQSGELDIHHRLSSQEEAQRMRTAEISTPED